MPHPAFARLRKTVLLVVTASGVVTVARKVLVAVRPARPTTDATTATAPPAPAPAEPGRASAESEDLGTPSPASIAKNVPHQRPVAAPAAEPHASPDDSPSGKLPPRR